MFASSLLRLLFVSAASVLFVVITDVSGAGAQSPDNLSRLVHPEVAERLGLSDSQRAEIQRLLQQRTNARQLEDEAERTEKLATLAGQIREQLSDQQWQQWQSSPPSGGLRFQFREQPWPEVLQWFAAQEDLTLVMDRAPPGTFTYRDTREYTAAQAIDLLNSVLLTRGYTLVRREKMLTLLQLTDSIPLELLPEVTLEELPSRGNFELVRVKFALGGRPVDAVLNEVTPYLGNFGRAIPLAQSGQLVVVETAGKMQTINVLINSVPVPKKPAPAKPQEKPPKPVFAAYGLGTMDADAALETIRQLIGEEGVTVDSQTRMLTAFVVPSKQMAVQAAIETMRENLGSARELASAAYELGEMTPEAIQTQLTALVPQAVIAVDVENDRVLVTGTSSEQERVAAALQQWGMAPAADAGELQVFQVEAGEANELAAALQEMLPRSQVLGNDTLGTVVVRGSAKELKLAEEVIARWRGDDLVLDQTLKTFDLPRPADDDWLQTAKRVVPKADLWLASGGKQLVLLGSETEAKRLEPLLAQLTTAIAALPRRELQTYTLAAEQLERWQQLETALADRLAEAKVVTQSAADGKPAEILVWATADDQQWIGQLIQQLQQSTPESALRWPQVYPLPDRDPELVAELIATRFPEARTQMDEASRELTVWAPKSQQTEIAELLDAIRNELPARPQPVVRGYRIPGMEPGELQTLLQPQLDQAATATTVTVDAARGRLLIRADEATHQRLEAFTEKLSEPLPIDEEKILMAYALKHVDAADTKTILESAVTGATIVADSERDRLIVTGNLRQQGQIKSLLGQLDQAGNPSQTKELRSYALQEIDPQAVLPTLQSLWPELELSVDATSKQIIASATPSEHQALQAALERLQSPADGGKYRVETYAVAEGNLQTLPAVLSQIAPRATVSVDEGNRTLVVWAGDPQHKRIAAALKQLSETADQREELLLFQLPPAEVTAYRTLVESLFPSVKVAVNTVSGQLTVLAPASMKVQIETVIQERVEASEAAEEVEPQSYLVPASIRPAFAQLLSTTFENASIVEVEQAQPDTVMVLAVPSDHARIDDLLQRLREALPGREATELKVYRLQQADPDTVSSLLAERRSQARIISGQGTNRLLIADTAEGHQLLKTWIDELEQVFGESASQALRVYPIRGDLTGQATAGIPTVAPAATILPGANPRRIAVLADEDTHQRIGAWLKQLESQVPPPVERISRVYPVRSGDPDDLARMLKSLLPDATFAPNDRGKSLAATATEDAHRTIADVVKQFDSSLPGDAQTRVFVLDRGSASAVSEAVSQMAPDARVNDDRRSNAVIVTAAATQMEAIAKLVEELEQGGGEPLQTRSYILENGNPITLQRALAGMYPQATVAADTTSGGLLVAATAEQHATIGELVEQLNAAPGRSPALQSYRLERADPEKVAEALEQAFGRRSNVGISAGVEIDTIFVVGLAEEQKIASELIKQLDQAEAERPDRELKVFSLSGGNGAEVVDAVQQLFADERPELEVEYDMFTERLVVVGTETQLQRVGEALQEFEPPERSLEIFSLQQNDPEPVQEAIESLFSELPYTTAPSVLVDDDRQQLLVRAMPEQFEEIRQLLQRLGESAEGQSKNPMAASGARVRSIPVGPDSEQLLRRLQEIWPSVRDNPLKVIRPGTRRGTNLDGASLSPRKQGEKLFIQADRSSVRTDATTDSQGTAASHGTRQRRWRFVSQPPTPVPSSTVGEQGEVAPPAADEANSTDANPTDDNPRRDTATGDGPSGKRSPGEVPRAESRQTDSPAVVIVPGGGSWTVASEDPEATAMIARLIESTLRPPVTAIETGTNHSVFVLQHAAAEELETVLTNLFERQRGRSRTEQEDRTRIVADARINALVVRGSRADRRTVGSLLSVLDSPEFVGAFEPSPPQYVPVENTDAERVEGILRTVYQAQLSSGGGRPPITIPAGIDPEISTMLRQINATASGPLLTISVDEITNAIVLRAPPELEQEVRSFIEQIDEQAGAGRRRGLRVIPLQGANAGTIQEALEVLRRSRR